MFCLPGQRPYLYKDRSLRHRRCLGSPFLLALAQGGEVHIRQYALNYEKNRETGGQLLIVLQSDP